MTCAQLADVAPQLALGILPGDERGRAVHHLESCAGCRELVAALTAVNDALVAVAPTAEPPAGFEERVLSRFDARPADGPDVAVVSPTRAGADVVTPDRRGRRGRDVHGGRRVPGRRGIRGRRGVAVGAALAAVAAVVAISLVVADPFGGDDDPAVAVIEMRTASGTVVGEARLEADDPPMLFLSLPGWIESIAVYGSAGESYSVLVEYRGGSEARLDLPATSESWWGLELPRGDVDRVRAVAIVDTVGRVWCRGTFS
jgi:hypothetical protein